MPFLFQVNLADVAVHDLEGLLPKKGLLSVFCDTSPDEIADSRVVYGEDAKKTKRLDWPEDLVDRKGEGDFVAQLPECAMSFYATWTIPSVEYLGAFAELSETEEDALRKLEGCTNCPPKEWTCATYCDERHSLRRAYRCAPI